MTSRLSTAFIFILTEISFSNFYYKLSRCIVSAFNIYHQQNSFIIFQL